MTLTEFYNLIKAVDADLSAYSGPGTGNYTVYHPYEIGGLRADGRIVEARLKVQGYPSVPLGNSLDFTPVRES